MSKIRRTSLRLLIVPVYAAQMNNTLLVHKRANKCEWVGEFLEVDCDNNYNSVFTNEDLCVIFTNLSDIHQKK